MADIRYVQVLFGNREFVGATESGPDDPFVVLKDPAFVTRIPVDADTIHIQVQPIGNIPDYVHQTMSVPRHSAIIFELNIDGVTMKLWRQATSGIHVPNGKELAKLGSLRRAN